jgi:MFS family permease
MDGQYFMSDTVPIIESDAMTSTIANYGLNETSPDRGVTSAEDVNPVYRQKRWRLCCRSASCVITFLCIAALGQSMSVNGLIGVTLSTIQRRFNLSSSQTAWITSAYEVAGIPALLIVGYIGSKLRRPLWIASGLVILNIGIFTYTIPHYITDPYPITSPNSSQLCSTSGSTDSCPVDFSTAVGVNKYLSLFVVASVLMGIGSVPLFVLGVTYIDDSTTHHTAAFYLGQYCVRGSTGYCRYTEFY